MRSVDYNYMRSFHPSHLIFRGVCLAAALAVSACETPGGGKSTTQPDTTQTGARGADGASLVRLGNSLEEKGDVAGAGRMFQQAIESAPDNADAHAGLGRTLLALSRPQDAKSPLKRALEISPGHIDAQFNLAKIYLREDNPGSAIVLLENIRPSKQAESSFHNAVGIAHDLLGGHEDARAQYSRGLVVDPNNAGLTNNLALSLAVSGDFDAAKALIGANLENPGVARSARANLASIYALSGDTQSAIELLQGTIPDVALAERRNFFAVLPTLTSRDRARAVFLGQLPSVIAAREKATEPMGTPLEQIINSRREGRPAPETQTPENDPIAEFLADGPVIQPERATPEIDQPDASQTYSDTDGVEFIDLGDTTPSDPSTVTILGGATRPDGFPEENAEEKAKWEIDEPDQEAESASLPEQTVIVLEEPSPLDGSNDSETSTDPVESVHIHIPDLFSPEDETEEVAEDLSDELSERRLQESVGDPTVTGSTVSQSPVPSEEPEFDRTLDLDGAEPFSETSFLDDPSFEPDVSGPDGTFTSGLEDQLDPIEDNPFPEIDATIPEEEGLDDIFAMLAEIDEAQAGPQSGTGSSDQIATEMPVESEPQIQQSADDPFEDSFANLADTVTEESSASAPSSVQVEQATARQDSTLTETTQGYRVQLAAYLGPTQAQAGWAKLQRRHPDLFGGRDAVLAEIDREGRDSVFRLYVDGFADFATGEEYCEELKTRQLDCFVTAARGEVSPVLPE